MPGATNLPAQKNPRCFWGFFVGSRWDLGVLLAHGLGHGNHILKG